MAEAADGKRALEILDKEQFDMIILDIMMPGVDGWTVCREVRNKSTVPIIMVRQTYASTHTLEDLNKWQGYNLLNTTDIIKARNERWQYGIYQESNLWAHDHG